MTPGQVFLGSEVFVREVAEKGEATSSGEVPRAQRRPAAPAFSDLAATHFRDEAIARAYTSDGYTLREIGDYFGLHYSHVSRIARGGREAKNKT